MRLPPTLTDPPLPLYACCRRRSSPASGIPAFLGSPSHFAATKLLPVSVVVSYSPVRHLEVVNTPHHHTTHPIRRRERPPHLCACRKVLQRFLLKPLVTLAVDRGSGGRGRQSFPCTSSCSELRLSLTSPSGSHSDSVPPWYSPRYCHSHPFPVLPTACGSVRV